VDGSASGARARGPALDSSALAAPGRGSGPAASGRPRELWRFGFAPRN